MKTKSASRSALRRAAASFARSYSAFGNGGFAVFTELVYIL